MRRAVMLALSVSALFACRAGADPFVPGEVREWEFLGQGKVRGSFERIEGGIAWIRATDGTLRGFDAGRAEGITGSWLQRSRATFPTPTAAPHPTPGDGPLIDLAATGLAPGALARWPNRGRLGGAFHAMNRPPTAATVHGRPAVVFAHAPWLLPLEYETLVSDFFMPEAATGGETLTVVAWLCNSGAVVDRETFLCWGAKDCGELDGPDFSYGCFDAMQWYDEKLAIPPARFPPLDAWHQFAFVVTPSDRERNRLDLTLYIDGERACGRVVRKPKPALLADNLAFLGCAWEAWWGHKWATRPARPYTGALGGLQVYDRALSLAEIRKLNGLAPAPAATNAAPAVATRPDPADGAREVPPGLIRVGWTPDPNATAQVLWFGTNRDDVARGSAPSAKLRGTAEEAFLPIDLSLPKLACRRTYYWRVASSSGPRATPVASNAAAATWSFTTSAFDLEFDGPVSEEFPKTLKQDGFYARLMDAGGYPIISPPGNDDVHLRAARHALRRLFVGKRPDVLPALQGMHAATHLASREHSGWGWSHFVCSSYGGGEAILREGAILLHETGHQFHMQAAEPIDPGFRQRLGDVFNASCREGRWMGDYAALNMWETVAVASSWWNNDMTQDQGDLRPRELLRRSDPRLYPLLAEFWPGDRIVDLHPASGLQTDDAGNVLGWANGGGIEYFRPDTGWRRYTRSTGSFAPVAAGRPGLRTVAGVSAVAFSGADALAWDRVTWDSLDGNRSWSADAWVFADGAAGGDGTILAWGTPSAPGAKLMCGASAAARLPGGVTLDWAGRPAPGRWHHFAWVYTGGGAADGPGELRCFIDGRPDGAVACKLALPPAARVTAGEGFRGALGHLRIYNYDLPPPYVADLHAREAPDYPAPDARPVAGRLLVDLDPARPAPACDDDTWPFYPASLNKPGLRSCVNRGTLGGKLHNDGQAADADRPRVDATQGAIAIAFDGRGRMISSFTGPLPSDATVEFWARAEPAGPAGSLVLQWGPWAVPAALLRAGAWQHVALTFERSGTTAYVDGKRAAAGRPAPSGPAAGDRLILGGGWTDGAWTAGFRGQLAALRIHAGLLTPEQVRQSAAAGLPAGARPVAPAPRIAATPVLDIDASTLPAGPVAAWTNRGDAGGVFAPAVEREVWRPSALEVAGRPGVDFSGRKGLVSSFPAPDALLGRGSFTVSVRALIQDYRGLEKEQTMLAWGRRPAARAEFCWGSSATNGAFIGAAGLAFGFRGSETNVDRLRHNAPLTGGWRHLAWTYDAATKKLRIYADGRLNREETADLSIAAGEPICLGGVRTGRAVDAPFGGLFAEVAIADTALDPTQIARLAAGEPAAAVRPDWLVRLDAKDLAPGPVDAWPNRGRLGGSFAVEAGTPPAPPRAGMVAGRAAVTFDGPAGVLRSSIPTPPRLTGNRPLTVELRVLNPKLSDIETIFGLAPLVAVTSYPWDNIGRAANFNFGSARESGHDLRPGFFSSGQSSRNVGWKEDDKPASSGAWQHLAFVCSGGYRGTFRVYLDGRPVHERDFFSLDTIGGHPMALGAAWSTAVGPMNPFSGSIARLKVYDYARTEEEIRAAAAAP